MELNLQYQQEFRAIDIDNSGLITKNEFLKYYRTNGDLAGSSDNFLEWMFAAIDNDNSGKISFKEFVHFADAKRQIDWNDTKWFERMIFRMMDTDKSGELDKDEFKRLLELLEVPTNELDQYLLEIDTDGNGTIDMDEFITFLERTA